MPLKTEKRAYILRLSLVVGGRIVEERKVFPGDGYVAVTNAKLVVTPEMSDKALFGCGDGGVVLWIYPNTECRMTTKEGATATYPQAPSLSSMPNCRTRPLEPGAHGKLVLPTGETVLFQFVKSGILTKRVKKPRLTLTLSRKGKVVERERLVQEEDSVTISSCGILCGPGIPEKGILISGYSEKLCARVIFLHHGVFAKLYMNGCLVSVRCRRDKQTSHVEGEIEVYPLILPADACGELQVGDDLLAFDYQEVEVDERVTILAEGASSATTEAPDAAQPVAPSPASN